MTSACCESRRGFGFDGVSCRAAPGARFGAGEVAREVIERLDVLEPLVTVAGEGEGATT